MPTQKCQLLKNRAFIGMVAVLLAIFPGAQAARALSAYLPVAGVSPLRFEVPTTNYFNYLDFEQSLAKAAEAASNATEQATLAGANTNNLSGTNRLGNAATMANTSSTSPAGMTGMNRGAEETIATSPADTTDTEKSYGQPQNFAFPSPTASDLLSVTPQMITQYFRPEPNETNQVDRPGVVVFVPAGLPFMPPTQSSTPESRAVYHSR